MDHKEQISCEYENNGSTLRNIGDNSKRCANKEVVGPNMTREGDSTFMIDFQNPWLPYKSRYDTIMISTSRIEGVNRSVATSMVVTRQLISTFFFGKYCKCVLIVV